MLDKSAVDQMVRGGEAAEDRQRREEVETRNQAEALTFQAERTLKDLGDKVSAEDRAEAENKIASAARGAQGSDAEAVKTGMTSLAETLQRISTAAYQAAAAESPNGSDGSGEWGRRRERRGEPAGSEPAGEGEPAGEETVEGEFKEV